MKATGVRVIAVSVFLIVFNSVPACPQYITAVRPRPPRETARRMTIRDRLGIDFVNRAEISPDGRWIVFELRKTLVDQNRYLHDLWLVSTSAQSQPIQLTHSKPSSTPDAGLNPRWSADSKVIAYFATSERGRQIAVVHLDTLVEESLTNADGIKVGSGLGTSGFISDLRWSPDGSSIAFLISSIPQRQDVQPNMGIEMDTGWRGGAQIPVGSAAPARLFIADTKTRVVSSVTDESLNVQTFSWSPDSARIALTASEKSGWLAYFDADLYTIDLDSRRLSTLVKQPGIERSPLWSPDGKWIVFESQAGREDALQLTDLAVVSVSGGSPVYLTEKFTRAMGTSPKVLWWSRDNDWIYFEDTLHMRKGLFRVRRETGEVKRVSPDDWYLYSSFSVARDGVHMAFTRESVSEPPDVFISTISSFKPLRLTELNKQLSNLAPVEVEALRWRSEDQKWTIDGVLIKPPGYEPRKKYPLILFLEGGPQMVWMGYDLSHFGTAYYSPLILATNGFLILAPNTRGRAGSGRDFAHAIVSEKSFGSHPFQDAISGVEFLLQRGVADSHRLGIIGGSYGGYLTAYGITQTDIFKAAAIWEGAPTDIPHAYYEVAANPNTSRLTKGTAYNSAFDPEQLREMVRESPIQNFQNVKTPILLEYGIESLASSDGRVLFEGARYFGVPSEFIVYPRTGHVPSEPLLREDSYQRHTAWFNYWLRDAPYADKMKQTAYDKWKNERSRKQ